MPLLSANCAPDCQRDAFVGVDVDAEALTHPLDVLTDVISRRQSGSRLTSFATCFFSVRSAPRTPAVIGDGQTAKHDAHRLTPKPFGNTTAHGYDRAFQPMPVTAGA
jgi:hypothetical protein